MRNVTASGRAWWGRGLRSVGARMGVCMCLALGSTGCSLDGLLNSDELPPDVSDPAITQTAEGARRAYHGVVAFFTRAFGGLGINSSGGATRTQSTFVAASALLSDELQNSSSIIDGTNNVELRFDGRTLPEDVASHSDHTYSNLQKARAQAGQAIRLLADYLPDAPALAGRLYALQGYTELFLAELFCSGIPLTTLDYEGDYTYHSGSTTTQVLTYAVALFDTALGMAVDSARFIELARVGQGRALLGLGQYAAAATAVATVPDDYRYETIYSASSSTLSRYQNFAALDGNNRWKFRVPDREGVNGMDWRSSGDPRTPTVLKGSGSNAFHYPDNYATDGSTPIVLASGVEARLIEAEAQLQAGDGAWLTTLNVLRTDGTFEVDTQVVTVDTTVDESASPPDTTIDTTFAYDTLWHAGSGGVDGLAPLTDPGTEAGRVDLLFRERAFWLYLTGHRQGDLRRLIRQYGRFEGSVYPVGTYPNGEFPYGSDVTAPIPPAEFVNPLFTGCASRGA